MRGFLGSHVRNTVLVLFLAAVFVLPAGCGAGAGGGDPLIDTITPSPRAIQYIRSDSFARLVIEVDSVAGFEPLASSASSLESRLEAILDKPLGVEVVNHATIASRGSDHQWTFAELRALAASTFDLAVDSDTVKMHVLCVDGSYATPGGGVVLGIAWDQMHITLFQQTIQETCAATFVPPIFEDQLCADAELAIWVHEVGHVLGLVDNGIPMQADHEDHDHEGHDRSSSCVMYWAYEGDALVSRVADDLISTGSSALDFDAECLDDIAAIRGG